VGTICGEIGLGGGGGGGGGRAAIGGDTGRIFGNSLG